ncbi:hypothetical protein LEMA_P036760.1 [Plenodomus lingam JN3]|uniref:C2H2-type domain-containing protein n=1 Tax=Leptosphaeria maculans (strain JN3 / isolate v23.1.3 / race Av1-4-5-6-7-8) TaxID=985895 RepID=E4ZQJ7_LEPMJ|nr:hypothetical protein LEMA_P036760.1 [Plenodomus lingam JN3]CBX94002.1 hypothetical protein LEMA_P036760.1 [Plenodomus lingam JN3]
MYTDQSTPPFNSPYQQHASRPITLLESSYPSPGRSDGQSKGQHGLGLYEYQQPLSTGLPSPQSSEVWNSHYSTVTSPLVTEALADPWASGAFDHPVVRSPLPWASVQTSPRSSLSYTREMSAFSHEESESAYPVKVEGSVWDSNVHFATQASSGMNMLPSSRSSPQTVVPNMYPYENAYPSPGMSRYEPTPSYDFNHRGFKQTSPEGSLGSRHSTSSPGYVSRTENRQRTRNRRHTDPAHALYHCRLCPGKGFARRYNYNQHILTHDTDRKKEHVCTHPGCDRKFVRKTDLTRHDQSRHQQARQFRCSLCPSAFARKDTLRRHETDGCPRRHQISVADPQLLSQLHL